MGTRPFMRKQLLQHCLTVNCLPDDQYGFLPQHSTVLQLPSVLQDWREAVDLGRAVHALIINVAKAFDRADHRLLCLKLVSIGVCEQDLKRFESYLRGRRISTSAAWDIQRRSAVSPWSTLICNLLPGSARLGFGYYLFICRRRHLCQDILTLLSPAP